MVLATIPSEAPHIHHHHGIRSLTLKMGWSVGT